MVLIKTKTTAEQESWMDNGRIKSEKKFKIYWMNISQIYLVVSFMMLMCILILNEWVSIFSNNFYMLINLRTTYLTKNNWKMYFEYGKHSRFSGLYAVKFNYSIGSKKAAWFPMDYFRWWSITSSCNVKDIHIYIVNLVNDRFRTTWPVDNRIPLTIL